MPTWGSTDALSAKPKHPLTRQVRPIANSEILTANVTTIGNTTVIFQGANSVLQTNAAAFLQNTSALIGASVYALANAAAGNGIIGTSSANLSSWGAYEFFASNVTVSTVQASGNGITLSAAAAGNVVTGVIVSFATPIKLRPNATGVIAGSLYASYNPDTILVTDTRSTNANVALIGSIGANSQTGWMRVQKKVNNDGTVRFLKETLVCLTNAAATNASSGNTSFQAGFYKST